MFFRALLLASWASASFAYYSWTKANTPANQYYWFGASSSASGQHLVVSQGGTGSNGITIISSDYGATWQQSQSVSYSTVVSDASGKYVFTQGGYVSSDYGNTFYKPSQTSVTNVMCDSKGKYLIGVQGTAQATQVVMISSDGGNSWQQSSCPQVPSIRFVSIDYSGQHMVTVSETADVFVSSDYGQTWTRTKPTPMEFTGVVSSGDGQYLYVKTYDPSGADGIDSTLLRSTDHGQSFQATGFPSPTINSGYNFAADSTGANVVVVCGGGVYVSHDYGKTASLELSGSHYKGVAISSSGDLIVAAASDQSGVMVGRWVN